MKIRVGFGLGVTATAGMDGETFWSIIDTCEQVGWDSIWFSERATADVPDPLASMAAVAGRTSRIKFGTSVLVLPGRNPVLLAKELATIDVLSGGRVIPAFGIGGVAPGEHEAFLVKRSEAVRRAEEAVELITRLWTEERVTHEGTYFTVRDLTIGPRPVQKPHPDIWFGGYSKAALRRVARLGTGWLPSFVTISEYQEKADTIRQLASEAGRQIDEEHFGALVAYLPEGREEADAVRAVVAARRPGVDPSDVVVTEGPEALKRRFEGFIEQGASKFVVIPALPPPDWKSEVESLYAEVAEALEN